MSSAINTIFQELEQVFKRFDDTLIEKSMNLLEKEKRIFVLGEGRSGLMAKSFAMRLMHLGFQSFVVGETITPSIQQEDVLVAISGSGTTSQVVSMVEKAQNNGITVLAITSNDQSPLAKLANEIVHIPSATKYRREGEIQTNQPLSSLFDQSVHIYFDAVCLELYAKQENKKEAFARHSNLE